MPTPHYRQLYQLLKKQILTGEFQEGDLLPSENALCAAHNITRATVRQALEELVRERYIYKHKGRGSVVSSQRKMLDLLSFRGFSEVAQKADLPVRTIFLQSPQRIPWENDFFYPLTDQERNEGCFFLKRLRCISQEPVMLEYTYVPDSNLLQFMERVQQHESLFETLHKYYEIEVKSVEQDMRAIAIDGQTGQLLNLEVNMPVLHIYRRYKTSRPGFYLYSSLYCNTAQYALSNKYDS